MIATTEKQPAPPVTPLRSQRSGASGNGHACAPTHDEIARLAYDLYVYTGWVQGRSLQNWLEAEQLLQHQSQEATRQAQQHSPEPFAPFAETRIPVPAPRRR